MRLIICHVILLGLLLINPACADEKQFIGRWTNYDEHMQIYDDFARNYEQILELSFNYLQEYDGPIRKPVSIRNEIETALILYSDEKTTILLITPLNSRKNLTNLLNEEFKRGMMSCADDKSWIVLLPENKWTEIDLNPYCTMAYSEDEIAVDLYWPESSTKPLIDIVTNGLTCVPHHLYAWDKLTKYYKLQSTKCTGSRIVESYAGSDIEMKQLY